MKIKGVTFVELVVVMAIMGILSIGLAQYITQAINLWDILSSQSDVINTARTSLTRMAREIRQMRRRIPGEYPIETADNNTLQFLKTSGADAARIRYRFVNNDLLYEIDSDMDGTFESGEPSFALVSNLDGFAFTYFDHEDVSTTQILDIYTIRIDMNFPGTAEALDLHYEIFPRSFKF
ncbi:MAG: type II secretion system protein [Candidatus Omnitrophota bacterium]